MVREQQWNCFYNLEFIIRKIVAWMVFLNFVSQLTLMNAFKYDHERKSGDKKRD